MDRCGLTITAAHYPAGASKWNPIEHRMFSEITKNWAGVPLESFETVVNFASTTKTDAGLRVAACRDQRVYQKDIKVSDKEMRTISLSRNDFLGKRNYTISPRCAPSSLWTSPHSQRDAYRTDIRPPQSPSLDSRGAPL